MNSFPKTTAKIAAREVACPMASPPLAAAFVALGVAVGVVVGTVLGKIPLTGIDKLRDELLACVDEGAGAVDKVPPGGDDVNDVADVLDVLDAPEDDTPEGRMPVGIPVDELEDWGVKVGIGRDVTLLPLPPEQSAHHSNGRL